MNMILFNELKLKVKLKLIFPVVELIMLWKVTMQKIVNPWKNKRKNFGNLISANFKYYDCLL